MNKADTNNDIPVEKLVKFIKLLAERGKIKEFFFRMKFIDLKMFSGRSG